MSEVEDTITQEEAFSMPWYVVQARVPMEKEVARVLRGRIAQKGVEGKFGKILIPTESVMEMRAGRKKRSERKLFPGYVLIQMDMDDETWEIVSKTPHVLGFPGGLTSPLPEEDVRRILSSISASGQRAKPKVIFEPGELVRVIDGPFSDFSGVVEHVNYDRSRLRVSVSIFGRGTPVELDFIQVEKS